MSAKTQDAVGSSSSSSSSNTLSLFDQLKNSVNHNLIGSNARSSAGAEVSPKAPGDEWRCRRDVEEYDSSSNSSEKSIKSSVGRAFRIGGGSEDANDTTSSSLSSTASLSLTSAAAATAAAEGVAASLLKCSLHKSSVREEPAEMESLPETEPTTATTTTTATATITTEAAATTTPATPASAVDCAPQGKSCHSSPSNANAKVLAATSTPSLLASLTSAQTDTAAATATDSAPSSSASAARAVVNMSSPKTNNSTKSQAENAASTAAGAARPTCAQFSTLLPPPAPPGSAAVAACGQKSGSIGIVLGTKRPSPSLAAPKAKHSASANPHLQQPTHTFGPPLGSFANASAASPCSTPFAAAHKMDYSHRSHSHPHALGPGANKKASTAPTAAGHRSTDGAATEGAKKKRCADRYDSSESSDSGVATSLSCTDSSTGSSEDASEPGSPYSPQSIIGDDHNQQQLLIHKKMPPQTILATATAATNSTNAATANVNSTSQHNTAISNIATVSSSHTALKLKSQQPTPKAIHPNTCTTANAKPNANALPSLQKISASAAGMQSLWPWNSAGPATSVSPVAGGNQGGKKRNSNTNTDCTAKKSRASNAPNTSSHEKSSAASIVSSVQPSSNPSQMGGNANTPKRLKAAALEESQTKITGYFKSQMKAQIHQNGKRQECVANSSIASGMTTSALTMSTPATTASLNKYFNILSQIKENNTNRDPQQKVPSVNAITSGSASGVTTSTTTVASTSASSVNVPNSITITPSTTIPVPALKKIERSKPTKIAQVAPNLRKTTSGNAYAGAAPGKSPKKHVAIAPRTPDMKPALNSSKEVIPKQQQQMGQQQQQQPAVLLTAIRMPTQGAQQQQTSSPQQHHTSNSILAAAQAQLKHPPPAAKLPATPPAANVVTPVTTAGAASTAASNPTLYQLPVQLPNLVQLPQLLAANGPNIMQLNSAAKPTPSTTSAGTSAQAAQAAAAQYFLNGTVFKLQQFTTATTTTATSAVAAAGSAPNINPFNFMNANELQEILLKQQQQQQPQQIQLQQQHQKSQATNTAASAAANIASFQEIFQQQVAAAVVASQQQQQQQQFQQLQRLSAAANIQQPVFMATPAGLLLNAASLPAMLAQAAAAIAANNSQQQHQKTISVQQQQLPALQPIQANAMPALSSIFGSANQQATPTAASQPIEPCTHDLQAQQQQQLQQHQQIGQLALVQPQQQQQQQFITATQPPPLSVVSSNTSSNNNTSTQSTSAPKLAIVKANTSQFSALSSQPPPLVTISSSSSTTKARPQVAAVPANATNIAQSKPSALAKPYQKRTPKISPSTQTKTAPSAKAGKVAGGKIVATPTTPPPLVPASSSTGTPLVINKSSPSAQSISTSNIKVTPALVSIQPIQTANQPGVKMSASSNISPTSPSTSCSENISNKSTQQLKSSSTKDLFDLVKNSSNSTATPINPSDGNFKKIKDEPMDEPLPSSTSLKAEAQTFSSHLRSDIKLELLEDATKMSSSNPSTMQECSSSSFSSHSNSVSSSADLSLEASTAASLTSSAPSPVPSSESALLNSPQPTPGSTCDSNSNSCTATTAASLATSQDHLNDLSSLSSSSSSASSIHLSLSGSSGSRGKSSISSESTEEEVGKRDLPTPESGIGGSLSNSQSSNSLASSISNIGSKASSPDLDNLNSMSNTTDSLLPSASQSTESNCCETQSDTQPSVATVLPPTTIDIQIADSSSTHLPKAAISPILSQPKTIRFPAESGFRYGSKGAKRHDGVCYWNKCNKKHDSSSKLLDHMQTQHVNSQTGPFACLWVGCKVYNKESCSRRWLERHVLSHGGSKQFKCIVEGCGLRFGSQLALQKHVNNHFNATENKDCANKRTSDPPVPKQLRKNGKKLRYRRQPFSARMFDFFDAGIMEGLQHRLRQISTLTNGCNSITFQGQCMMKRRNCRGTYECFIRWSPREIISDEWLPECNEPYVKTVNIKKMHPIEKTKVESLLMTAYRLPYSPNLFEPDLSSDNYQENGGEDDCNSGKSDAGESDKDEDDNDDDIENETSVSEAHEYASTVSNYQQVLSIAKLQMQQRKKHPRKPQKRIQ